MALWPFRRRASRKRSAGRGRAATEPPGLSRSMTAEPAATAASPVAAIRTAAGATGPINIQKQRVDSSQMGKPNKLQRRPRTNSFTPGRRDSIRVARTHQEAYPPPPTRLAGQIPAASNEEDDVDRGHWGPGGSSKHGAAKETDFRDRVPTLHHHQSRNKRSGQPLSRRKSSKRRKGDHDREADISAPSHAHTAPLRPSANSWTMGRLMKKDSKRVRPGLTRNSDGDSDISTPIPDSIHSSLSSDSEQASWRVSSFAALAPRPTLRYASNPIGKAPSSSGPVRDISQKRKISERGPISKETLRAHKRIDDLANDFDASDLRELMERDKRRKERKAEKERERVERRLARRSEGIRADEAEAARNGTPSPRNLERGVLGREVGLGLDPSSAVPTSSRRRPSTESPRQREKRPAGLTVDELEEEGRAASPVRKFHRTGSVPLESTPAGKTDPLPDQAHGRPQPPLSRSRSQSPKIMGFIRSKKHRSKSPTKEDKADTPPTAPPHHSGLASESKDSVSAGRTSDASSSRPWTSIFKWGKNKARRTSGAPPSFSNTSRSSMRDAPVAQPPAQPPTNYIPARQLSSKVPKRTMSRFREDLPELPLSPPDSRVASPEGDAETSKPLPLIDDDISPRYETPVSMDRDETQPSPAPMSMSLASIDSEASWLSRKARTKRGSPAMLGSIQNHPYASHHSGDSKDQHMDEDAVLGDESNEPTPRSDGDETSNVDTPKWGSVNRAPRVVSHTDTMRSREGLLSYVDDDKELGRGRDSIAASLEGEVPTPRKARSISVQKRQSAKLMEIAPRASHEQRAANEPITQ